MKDELDFLNELLHHVDGIECPKAWELITNRIQSLTAEEEG